MLAITALLVAATLTLGSISCLRLAITTLLVAVTLTPGSTSCLMLAITTLLVAVTLTLGSISCLRLAIATLGKVCLPIINGTIMFTPHETILHLHIIGGVKLVRIRSAALPAGRIRLA
jgi:hypothetical protein